MIRPATSAARPSPASDATWDGTFPAADCPSNDPSPVITTDAAAAASGSPISSATAREPGSSVAPHASSPKPVPPAAPAPGVEGSAATSLAKPASAASS